MDYINQRLREGCLNKSQLWREIRDKGYTGTREMVGKWIRQHYASQYGSATPTETTHFALPTVVGLSWLLIRSKADLENEEERLLQLLLRDPQILKLRTLARHFINMITHRQSHRWEEWLELVDQSSIEELKRFVQGLKKDESAIIEALRQPYSNGRTEGHINRLKLIKRQMYGRANFDLLRLRVLLA